MRENILNKNDAEKILTMQKNEITEYHLYSKLSESTKHHQNSKLLRSIAEDELSHYNFLKGYTKREVKPSKWKILAFYLAAKIFGLTFSLKLMEKGEERAQDSYEQISKKIPEALKIAEDEDKHEKELIDLIEEERLQYVGSIVLGLNDALVELTGTLSGLTFALQNTRLIALAGLITGIAAAFSMAASEYLSTKSEGNGKNALKSSMYTGFAYILTVFFLILPYLLLKNYFLCLILTVSVAVFIIFIFNFYISVAKDLEFRKRFLEMAAISLGVTLLTFIIGYFIKGFLGVDI